MIQKDEYGWIWETHKCKGGRELYRLINGNVDTSWQIVLDKYVSVNELKYCPYCGKKLKEITVIEAMQKLNHEKAKRNMGAGI